MKKWYYKESTFCCIQYKILYSTQYFVAYCFIQYKQILIFNNFVKLILIAKRKFHYFKNSICIADVDIDEILISNKFSLAMKGYKYFIGYKDVKKVKPLYIMLQKKWFDKRKTMQLSDN